MDQKLAKYFNLLKEESEATRRGASAEVIDIIEDISTLTSGLVDEGDISFVVAAVFDEDSGILSAVETLLPSRDRVAVKAKDNCFTFLAQFISRFGKRTLTYAPFVKAKCMGIFRREDSRSVQAAALSPLLSILELSMQESIPLDISLDWTWAESLLVEYRKARTAGTLRSNILMLIGYAVEKFPALFREEHLDIIVKLCLDTLEEELHRTGNNPVYVLVTGAVKCLDSLLLWFDRTMPAGGSVENSRKIYAYVEQVIHFREDLKRYEMVKAGLRLLSRHANLFRLRLLENSMVILKWLQSYCKHGNRQLRDAAFPAFEQFISEIVSCITSDDQRAKNSHQTYKRIFSDALGVLDSPGSDPQLTSLAILTVGKLSPLIVKFSGKGSLLQTFYRLVPFGGSPHRDTNGREESSKFSVTLVGAFAGMVVYLDDIENYTVSLIAKAVGNAFHGFPYMFSKQRYVLYASLHRLFKALYSRDAVFTVFLNNIVWSSLERAMGHDDERELGEPLWKHYVELWSQLLVFCSTARKGHENNHIDTDNSPFSESSETSYGNIKDADLQASIFDCLLKSIMKAMIELNLKYRVKSLQVHELGNSAREQDLTADASGNEAEGEFIEPLDPLEMRKFLNLVEFVQELLSRNFINLFLKWVYPFGRFLVELSSRYPLISGFYKLLAICIHKAEERAYFGNLESLPITKITHNENEIENPPAENSLVGQLVSQQDRDLCKNLFRKYLQEVLVASRRYKLELFASCLRLCLSAPPPVMDIEFLVAPTISALKIGLRYPCLFVCNSVIF
ncbi:uncharacterized protein LOC131027990 isoform X1 [Cryptomeria japonica]|uniref:uncharacterized protein LOC131027990 isoform X1 n=1 Tax=Cryptomeria japonica TaxID=3369 RepID=UPI0025ACD98E|nr:uncharacterized protein LOC131027990 isoform X1 [Cryptomeria japonica]